MVWLVYIPTNIVFCVIIVINHAFVLFSQVQQVIQTGARAGKESQRTGVERSLSSRSHQSAARKIVII